MEEFQFIPPRSKTTYSCYFLEEDASGIPILTIHRKYSYIFIHILVPEHQNYHYYLSPSTFFFFFLWRREWGEGQDFNSSWCFLVWRKYSDILLSFSLPEGFSVNLIHVKFKLKWILLILYQKENAVNCNFMGLAGNQSTLSIRPRMYWLGWLHLYSPV